MNKIVLTSPIMINGKEVRELTYDVAKITAGQFCEAEARKNQIAGGKNAGGFTMYETDAGLHLYLGMIAIIAENPHIDVTDLERIKGIDMIQMVAVGRNFIFAGVKALNQSSAADSSETTPEPSEPQSES